MNTDNRPDPADRQTNVNAENFFQPRRRHFFETAGFLLIVAIADQNIAVFRPASNLFQIADEKLHRTPEGFFPTPADTGGMNFTVLQCNQRFYIQQRPRDTGNFADTPAVAEIFQIPHGKENPCRRPQFFHDSHRFPDGMPLIPQTADFQHIGALHHRGRQRIQHNNPTLRIFLQHHFFGNFCRLQRGAQLRGDADTDHILSLFDLFPENPGKILRRRRRRFGKGFGRFHHPTVKFLPLRFAAFFPVMLPVKGNKKRNNGNFIFFDHCFRQVTGTVADNTEPRIHHNPSPFSAFILHF